jgi:Ca2+/H+ antiporter, TMEM165/GDT1 family
LAGAGGEGPPMASVTAALTTFAVIFLAELPDKTALATLVLSTRYRPLPVLCGVGAGFIVQVLLAVLAGSLLGLVPHHILAIVVAVLFLGGAGFLLASPSGHDEEKIDRPPSPKFWVGAGASFMVVLVAEFGDLTQVVTANLVARYHDPIAVGIGSVAGMWAVAVIAVLGGRNLLRLVPMKIVTRVAAALMVALAGFSLASAFG